VELYLQMGYTGSLPHPFQVIIWNRHFHHVIILARVTGFSGFVNRPVLQKLVFSIPDEGQSTRTQ
jgi:hypothetical protein